MSVAEIRAYLSHLAIENNVAASTQNVALSALLFLYRQFLGINGERSPFRRLRTRAIAVIYSDAKFTGKESPRLECQRKP